MLLSGISFTLLIHIVRRCSAKGILVSSTEKFAWLIKESASYTKNNSQKTNLFSSFCLEEIHNEGKKQKSQTFVDYLFNTVSDEGSAETLSEKEKLKKL